MSLDDQHVLCEAGDLGQGFDGIVAMVKDSQIKNDIELTDRVHRKVCDIDLARSTSMPSAERATSKPRGREFADATSSRSPLRAHASRRDVWLRS